MKNKLENLSNVFDKFNIDNNYFYNSNRIIIPGIKNLNKINQIISEEKIKIKIKLNKELDQIELYSL